MEHEHTNQAEGLGTESSALDVKPIVLFLIGLTLATILIGWLMVGLFDVLEASQKKEEGASSPLASERQVIPPEPRLQLAPTEIGQLERKESPNIQYDDPIREMERYRDEQEEKLNNYGWVDERAGTTRIPIEKAKELLLMKGLPTRKQ